MARVPIALLTIALLLAGCVQAPQSPGGGTAAGGDAPAPAWAVGDAWTFRVTGDFSTASGNASMSGERSTRVTWTVVNATTPVDDAPAVHVRVHENDADADLVILPFFPLEPGLWAFHEESLDPRAFATTLPVVTPRCGPDAGSAYGRVPARSGWPLRFPLTPGAEWSADGADVRVHEWEDVKTLAGSFRALRVTTTLREHPFASPDRDDAWQMTLHHWYAPDARHVVLAEAAVTHRVRDPSGTLHEGNATTRIELESFSRDPAAADEPVPTTVGAEWPWVPETRRPSYRIGTDTPPPVNLANGSVTARFALVNATEGTPTWRPGLVFVDDLDAARVRLDGNASVTWRLSSFFADALDEEHEGDVFEHALDAVAEFDLDALVKRDCLPFDEQLGRSAFTTHWNASRTVRVDAGEPTPVDVAVVPVKHPFPKGHVTWELRRDATGDVPPELGRAVHGEDAGTLVVYDETGDFVDAVPVDAVTGTATLDLWSAEAYRFVWEPRNDGELAQGRVNGHEVTFTIRVSVNEP